MKKYFLVIAFCIFLFAGCRVSVYEIPQIENGYLDLSTWDFGDRGPANLNGNWEFYWEKLYSPADFVQKKDSNIAYIRVPSSWRGREINGKEISGLGFATYRAVVYLPGATGKNLGMKVMDCFSSYKLFVDGKELARNGVVSPGPGETKPQFLPKAVTFTPGDDTLEIIFQVANNFTYEGGLWQDTQLGTANQILETTENIKLSTFFFIGALFILIIYHFFIFFLRRNEWSSFWFAVLVTIAFIRTVLVGDRLFYQAFPDFPLVLGFRIEYIDFIPLTTVFLLFLYNLDRIELHGKIVRAYLAITIAECLLVTFSSVYFFTSLLPLFIIVMSAGLIIALAFMINLMRKKQGYKLLFVVSTLVIISSINDVLYSLQIINTFFFAHYVFGLLLLAQAYILASRFATSYITIGKLSSDLNFANVSLERKVEERTRDLEIEKKKSDDLLLNILPAETAAELKQHGHSKAKTYSMVTVMFADFKDFTTVSEKVSAELLVAEIDYCFSAFDNIIQKHGIEKIKTVGDAYLCAAGMPVLTFTHAQDMVNAAIEIRNFMLNRKKEKEARGEIPFEIRIGIHTGPVVAGIVGVKKFGYDIWGDTVNIASRMESSGEVGKVNISGATYELVRGKFKCTYRGKILAKNKGEVDMYFLESLPQNA